MFNNPVYIPSHAVDSFRGRVCNALSAKIIRKLIMYFISTTKPIKHQMYNHELQPIYRGEFDSAEFYIPVIKDKKKHGKNLWHVVPTILLSGMPLGYRKEQAENRSLKYVTAQDLARELKIDRTTVVEMIKKGTIKALCHTGREKYRIHEKESRRVAEKYTKSNKSHARYSSTEIQTFINNKDKSNEYVAGLINRNKNSVKIMRCRLRKKGYDV